MTCFAASPDDKVSTYNYYIRPVGGGGGFEGFELTPLTPKT